MIPKLVVSGFRNVKACALRIGGTKPVTKKENDRAGLAKMPGRFRLISAPVAAAQASRLSQMLPHQASQMLRAQQLMTMLPRVRIMMLVRRAKLRDKRTMMLRSRQQSAVAQTVQSLANHLTGQGAAGMRAMRGKRSGGQFNLALLGILQVAILQPRVRETCLPSQ
jgi:hypothetical protein